MLLLLSIFSLLYSPVPKSVKSAKDFTPEALNFVVVKALKLINPDEESIQVLIEKLPANVAARHRVATAVANAIKSNGYNGEGGYNSLLYPNERDVRRLLSWVVQKLPRNEDNTNNNNGLGGSILFRNVAAWLTNNNTTSSTNTANTTVNIPPSALEAHERSLANGNITTNSTFTPSSASSSTSSTYLREQIITLIRKEYTRVPEDNNFNLTLGSTDAVRTALSTTTNTNDININLTLPSLEKVSDNYTRSIANNDSLRRRRRRVGASYFPGTQLDSFSSPFTRRAAFAIKVIKAVAPPPAPVATVVVDTPKAKTEEEIAKEREEEINTLQLEVDNLTTEIDSLISKRTLLSSMVPALRTTLNTLTDKTKELERNYLIRKACLEMLPNAEEHIIRLTNEIETATNKLLTLGQEWEQHRKPLLAAIYLEESRGINQRDKLELLQKDLLDMRNQANDIATNIATKEEMEKRLTVEVAKVQASMAAAGTGPDAIITRPVYTRRILDVVRQIRKQKAEIARIVNDVRTVQNDLNIVSEKVRKTASSATENMERAAVEHAKDPAYRQALRLLLALQDAFNNLINAVTIIGQAENETRDMENRIEQMQQRNDAQNTAQLLKDIASIKEENAQLQARKK